MEDNEQNLWVATADGPTQFKSNSFIKYSDFHKSVEDVKLYFLNGKVWHTNRGQAGFFDGNKFVVFSYKEYSISNAVNNRNFRLVGVDDKGNIYTEYNTMKNAFVCKFDGTKWTQYKLPNSSKMLSGAIYSSFQDDDYNFWLLTTLGVMKFDGENFKVIHEVKGGPFAHRMETLHWDFSFVRNWATGIFEGVYLFPEG